MKEDQEAIVLGRNRGVKRMTSPLNETSIRPRKAIKKLRELMIEQ
jgi:hypothetical protein